MHGRVAELTAAAEAAAPAAASAAAAAAEGMRRLRAELACQEAALQTARAQADQARHSQTCIHTGSVPAFYKVETPAPAGRGAGRRRRRACTPFLQFVSRPR